MRILVVEDEERLAELKNTQAEMDKLCQLELDGYKKPRLTLTDSPILDN